MIYIPSIILGVFLGLIGFFLKRELNQVTEKLKDIEKYIKKTIENFATHDGKFNHIDSEILTIQKRLDSHANRISETEKTIEKLKTTHKFHHPQDNI